MRSFCGKTEESLEHLFIYCHTSKHLWSSVTEWLDEVGFDVRYLSTFDITFGLTSKDIYMLFTGLEARIGKNCARGLT